MDFRDRLREEISFSGLLDKEVAAKAGIAKHAIDTYVGSRACMPSADVAVRLAKVLNTTVEYLVTGNESEKSKTPNDRRIKELVHVFTNLSTRDKNILLSIAHTMEKINWNSIKLVILPKQPAHDISLFPFAKICALR